MCGCRPLARPRRPFEPFENRTEDILDNPDRPSRASLEAVDIPAAPLPGAPRTDNQDAAAVESTDFVQVATCGTPTEAHLLKGVLQGDGLSPAVADRNILQANPWMTQAVGGVRVLVPPSQLAEARRAIAAFDAGAFQLEGEAAAPTPTVSELASPAFSPDRATLLGFVPTPAFDSALQLANAIRLGTSSERVVAGVWFALLAALSVVGVAALHRRHPGPFVVFRASLALSAATLAWYFLAAQPATKRLIATYGSRYPRRPLAPLSLAAAGTFLVIGGCLAELA